MSKLINKLETAEDIEKEIISTQDLLEKEGFDSLRYDLRLISGSWCYDPTLVSDYKKLYPESMRIITNPAYKDYMNTLRIRNYRKMMSNVKSDLESVIFI